MPLNKENHSYYYFKEIFGNICIGDSLGKFVLLGGKKSLHLANTTKHYIGEEVVLKSTHKSFSTAAWKPNKSDAFITSSTKTVDLWQCREGEFQVKSSFNGYSRNVCDIDWSLFNIDLVATSSHNNISFILDTRDLRRPCTTIESLLPISQIRWNKMREYQVATCHGEVINVWDIRNVKQCRLCFSLRSDHLHINSFDWCPYSEHHIISSSLTGFVKFWDVSKQNEEIENLFNFSQVDIKEAKYTPYGRGIVAQCVSKAAAELYLWSLTDDLSINQQVPAHSFTSSCDILQWFFRLNEGEPQLVAWTADQCLKFWDIAPFLVKETIKNTEETPLKHEANTSPRSHKPQNLTQEFESLKLNYPRTVVEKKSLEERELRVVMEAKGHKVHLSMVMLDAYPSQAPLFSCLSGSNINGKEMRLLDENLKQTSRSGECCIEACLKTTLHFLESLQRSTHVTEANELSRERLVGENIPFPRTSGARFCGPGFLVCFTRRVWVETSDVDEEPERRKIFSESNMGTPRAMSALSEVAAIHSKKVINLARSLPTTSHIPSISQFFEDKEHNKEFKKEHKPRVHFKASRHKSPNKSYKRSLGPVIIYDLSCLLPIQKCLGESYVFRSNVTEMCRLNASAALAAGRKDLHQVWSLVALQLTESVRKDAKIPWSITAFGKSLIDIWIEHFSKVKDIQTLAMLCCVLMPAKNNKNRPLPAKDFQIHRNLSIFMTSSQVKLASNGRRKHSNSLSESCASHCSEVSVKHKDRSPTPQQTYNGLCSLSQKECDRFIHSYASILFQWGFIHQRVQLINSISQSNHDFKKDLAGLKKQDSTCVVCRMPVPGLFVSCFDCGHGGHVKHLSVWFRNHKMCATGCGCLCLSYTNVSMT